MNGSSLSYCSATELINSTRDCLPFGLILHAVRYVSCLVLIILQQLFTSVSLLVEKFKSRNKDHVTKKWAEIICLKILPSTSYIFSTDTPETHPNIHNLWAGKKNPKPKPNKVSKNQIPRLIPPSKHACTSILSPGFQQGRASLQERCGWEWFLQPESKSALTLCLDVTWQVVKVINHSWDAVSERSWHLREKLPYKILCMSLWQVFH